MLRRRTIHSGAVEPPRRKIRIEPMRTPILARYALGVCTAVSVLAGCNSGGSSATITPRGVAKISQPRPPQRAGPNVVFGFDYVTNGYSRNVSAYTHFQRMTKHYRAMAIRFAPRIRRARSDGKSSSAVARISLSRRFRATRKSGTHLAWQLLSRALTRPTTGRAESLTRHPGHSPQFRDNGRSRIP